MVGGTGNDGRRLGMALLAESRAVARPSCRTTRGFHRCSRQRLLRKRRGRPCGGGSALGSRTAAISSHTMRSCGAGVGRGQHGIDKVEDIGFAGVGDPDEAAPDGAQEQVY